MIMRSDGLVGFGTIGAQFRQLDNVELMRCRARLGRPRTEAKTHCEAVCPCIVNARVRRWYLRFRSGCLIASSRKNVRELVNRSW
jgi:hypothetical protein